MTNITSRTDLETYIANVPCGEGQTADEVTAIAGALLALDHPTYGSDWSAWLEEHYEATALSVLCPADARTVRDYDTDKELDGAPSAALCAASDDEGTGTGAVGAYRDRAGIWQYVREDEMSSTPGSRVVYVEPVDA